MRETGGEREREREREQTCERGEGERLFRERSHGPYVHSITKLLQ